MVLLYTNTLTYQWVSEAAQVGNARRESGGAQVSGERGRRASGGGCAAGWARPGRGGPSWRPAGNGTFFAFFNGHRSRFYNRWWRGTSSLTTFFWRFQNRLWCRYRTGCDKSICSSDYFMTASKRHEVQMIFGEPRRYKLNMSSRESPRRPNMIQEVT
jgi:hypothetical protein